MTPIRAAMRATKADFTSIAFDDTVRDFARSWDGAGLPDAILEELPVPPHRANRDRVSLEATPRIARSMLLLVSFALGLVAAPADALVVDPTFPGVNWAVKAGAIVGDTIYFGGTFTRVGTVASEGITGSAQGFGVPSPKWPAVSGIVQCVASDDHGGWYIGGLFTSVAGVARRFLAHILPDGTLDGWGPEPDGR